jgi:hypothetical protein
MQSRARSDIVPRAKAVQPINILKETTMRKWRNGLVTSAGLTAVVVVWGLVTEMPSVAQVRAALVRDIDTPALQPVRIYLTVTSSEFYGFADADPVPAGKRLVIEGASIFSYVGDPTTERVYAVWLTANPQVTYVSLDPSPNDTILPAPGYIGYNRNFKLYYNPGEVPRIEVWAYGDTSKTTNVYLTGYYVTL